MTFRTKKKSALRRRAVVAPVTAAQAESAGLGGAATAFDDPPVSAARLHADDDNECLLSSSAEPAPPLLAAALLLAAPVSPRAVPPAAAMRVKATGDSVAFSSMCVSGHGAEEEELTGAQSTHAGGTEASAWTPASTMAEKFASVSRPWVVAAGMRSHSAVLAGLTLPCDAVCSSSVLCG
jgi:hypothetical protein